MAGVKAPYRTLHHTKHYCKIQDSNKSGNINSLLREIRINWQLHNGLQTALKHEISLDPNPYHDRHVIAN